MGLLQRTKNAWNAFRGREPTTMQYGSSSYYRPDRRHFGNAAERSIIAAICNRIALDAASIDVKHVQCDSNGNYVYEFTDKGLDQCLNLEANIDQTARDFRHDVYMSMFEEGDVAVVPIDVDIDPTKADAYDIITMRTGKIVAWYPQHVRVKVYNDRTGRHEELTCSKEKIAIIHNPFYAIMNEPNSTLKRLTRKLALLDYIDEQSGSGKLDLVIQLPYAVKSEARKARAEERRKDIETQLAGSKYGIAWIDQTEHITQLNRSITNNLLTQIESLTSMLYSQLNIDETVLKGTADEKTMLNYNNRVIEVVVSALTDEYKRKFLTKNARTRMQSIMFFRDPFRLVPVSDIAEIGDKMSRNEIMTSNELRQKIGLKPSSDPNADVLRNKNLSEAKGTEIPHEETNQFHQDMEAYGSE